MSEMKDSGAEWIGEIPASWHLERLQLHMEEVNISNNPIQSAQILSLTNRLGVVPYEEKGNQGNKSKGNLTDYKLAYPDTLVVNSMNVIIGSVGISKYFGCVSPVYYVFKAKENDNIRFLNYVFQTVRFQKELRRFANGILEIRMRVSSKNILKRMIPFPTLDMQARISDYLDYQCSRIDTIVSDIERQIDILKAYKQSIISEAVIKGLDSNVEMKDSGMEWIGEIPAAWHLERLQWHMEEVNVSNNPIQTTQILSLTNSLGVIPYEEKGNQGNKSKEDLSEYKIAYPDTLVVNSMNVIIGSSGISKYFGCVSPVYYVFRAREDDNIRFFNYVFQTVRFQKELRRYSNGILEIRLRVSSSNILKRMVPFPSLSTQKRITDFLDSKCSKIDAVMAEKKSQLSELANYKKNMIYEYVTGKKEIPT